MKKVGKKLGRKPVSAEKRRDKKLDFVRFSPAEIARIKAEGEKHGSVSAYVRERLGL